MLGEADGMVLHARTAPNVTQHDNLDVVVLGVLRGPVLCRPGVAQAAADVGQEPPAIVDEKDEETACNDGENERDDHDG